MVLKKGGGGALSLMIRREVSRRFPTPNPSHMAGRSLQGESFLQLFFKIRLPPPRRAPPTSTHRHGHAGHATSRAKMFRHAQLVGAPPPKRLVFQVDESPAFLRAVGKRV